MPVVPDDLTLAGRRLYDQFRHLEPRDGTYPWAAVCAMLAAPVDPLYDLVAGADVPWAPAMDPELATEVLDADTALKVVRWLGQFTGLTLAESLTLLQQRVTLFESSAAVRMRPAAIIGAVRAAGLEGPDGEPGSATVFLIERVGGDPYEMAIATVDDQTPDPAAVERALLAHIGEPNGARKWTYTVLDGSTWADLAATHADWAEVAADFDTWVDVRADPTVT